MIYNKSNLLFLSNNLNLKKKSLNLNFLLKNYLYKNIALIFFKNKNKLYIQGNLFVIRLYFINFYFLKLLSEKLNKKKKINFIFLQFKKFFSFFMNFFNIYNNMNNLYFFRLKLRGLGFVLKRYSKFLFSFSWKNLTSR